MKLDSDLYQQIPLLCCYVTTIQLMPGPQSQEGLLRKQSIEKHHSAIFRLIRPAASDLSYEINFYLLPNSRYFYPAISFLLGETGNPPLRTDKGSFSAFAFTLQKQSYSRGINAL